MSRVTEQNPNMAGKKHIGRNFTHTQLQLIQRSLLSFYILMILLSSVVWKATGQSYPTFEIPYSSSVFQNQFLDPSDGNLYIGGLNYIYKVNSDLDLIRSAETGPVNDSLECRPPSFGCDKPKTSTDNYNKVILVHESRLITCGSVYQGICRIRDFEHLNVTYGDSIQEVVPNIPSGLAVAFVANGDNDRVLYVASSYGDWLRDVPTVSTRLISQSTPETRLFKVSSGNAKISIPATILSGSPGEHAFNISYIYGFTSGKFSYFAASQPRDYKTISRYTSKLVRLCHGDPDFNSYIELALVCGIDDDESDYNLIQSAYLASLSLDGGESKDILIASFSKSDLLTSSSPKAESAICIYSIDDINQAFYDRHLDCAEKGTDNTEISWAGSTGCVNIPDLYDFINKSTPADYCHTDETQNPLGGDTRDITISAIPLYQSSTHITAVAAVQHFQTPIIFSGDSSGNFKKLRLDDSNSAEVYDSLDLHQTPVIRNGLLISLDEEFVFITSEDQITKVPVEECHEYTTCEECHNALDPYCGWCSLQAECTRRIDAQCQGSQNGSSSRWLSHDDDCLAITSVSPEFAHADAITELMIDVSKLPIIPTGSLKCAFLEGTTLLGSQTATVAQDMSSIRCNTPQNIMAAKEGFKTVDLQLHYEEDGQSRNIASTPFDFYDCTKLSSCAECAGNKYGCQWCLHSDQCIDSTQSCNMSDIFTNSSICPLIRRADQVLIPAGQTKELQFAGVHFPDSMFSFSCQIQFTGLDKLLIPARVINDQIRCDATLFNYSSSAESINGSLQVFWGDFTLDMEEELIVTIYKCNRMAVTMLGGESRPTCGMCLSIDARYGCGWCPPLDDCLSPVNAITCPQNELLSQDENCPNPTIVSFFPTSGHVAGGTKITIRGYNLGLGAADIQLISVAKTFCTSMEFVSSQLLYCTTDSVVNIRQGKVNVTFNNSQTLPVLSEEDFSFVKPTIVSSYPVRGPRSGGTRLVVRGINLDAGLSRTVMISSTPCDPATGYPCNIVEEYSHEIICITSAGIVNVTEGQISVYFDRGCVTGGGGFAYLEDPVVHSFEKLSSIASGGLDLMISGDSFDIIQEARLEFRIGPDKFPGDCFNSSSSKMELICKSPNVSAAQTEFPLSLSASNVSLYMDGVMEYRDLGSSFVGSRSSVFEFVIDPVYYQLPTGEDMIQVPYDKQRQYEIVIKGTHLNLASSWSDVTVTIGKKTCVVFSLNEADVSCRSDEQNIEPGSYFVKVYHGNLEFNVGKVRYLNKEFPWQILAAIISGTVVLFLVILIIIILYCCCINFSNSEKNFKELEEQMIAMETVVAQECKEAFAELQTGVLSITDDVEGTGIPMWDYKSYAMWALFPNQPNHPVLRELAVPQGQRDSVRNGLNRFGLLLANKSFLVQFVGVLEKQNTISIEDFSNIASLLMVCFQGRMDYATEVMKTLLSKAIKEHVRDGQQAVLMRRGVHIVEKIVSHWLAFLMYPYLEGVAGDPLFSLFYAIHCQISRGPVDEVTSVARYGLNEGAIIRQQVEHSFMNLYVKGIENNLDEKKVLVLDCDTISQVKEKILEEIYKTSPYSNRPHKGEVDLEWTDSPSGRMLLMDYDGAKSEDGWRLLNTLKTYKVPDNASVALLHTQNGNTSLSSSSSSPSRSIIYANMSSTSSMTPIITHEKEQGVRFMHLVKQTDNGSSKKFDGKNQKVIAEIYLTRLLTTKGIIHPFVEDMLTTILTTEEDGANLPLAIKYLFDFLDEQAFENNIKDPDIVHQWKTNCLQLRFWVNLIKNPNFVFDINKTPAVDNCLSVIGQFLMDSCSISKQTLTKDSPSSRLLYANEIERSRDMVVNYYRGISKMPPISDQDMNTMLAGFSNLHQKEFYNQTALNELYFCYACKCRNELMAALQQDEPAQKYCLVKKLLEVERLLAS